MELHRAGWDANRLNFCEMAQALEEVGVAFLALHPRTRAQGYAGRADWTRIAKLKQAVKRTPIIGNGDVVTPADARRMLEETGCDAVMIGRGALGNPWIFRELEGGAPPTAAERCALVLRHFDAHIVFVGRELPALREYDVGGDGIIGIDALTSKRLLMDFEKKLIKVEDASVPYHRLPGEIDQLEEELEELLIPRDPLEDRDAIIELRAGTGGDEAALFAGDLYEMYTRYARAKGWTIEAISHSPGEAGGFKEITFGVAGDDVYQYLRYESGGHRVQRVPATETQGRIHTSLATVAVLPEPDEVQVTIAPADIEWERMRAGGAGGQHVNKTESAVRIWYRKGTTDEMAIVFIGITVDSERVGWRPPAK